MSKKLLYYGFAFGSASAAFSYIYLTTIVYHANPIHHLISIMAEFLIVPGLGIFLFLKTFKKQNPSEFMMGRAVFLGFFLSVIIGASVSLLFSYLAQFRPEIIARVTDLKIREFQKNKFFSEMTAKEIEDTYNNIRASYSTGRQFISQLFLGAARGLFLSSIFAYFMKARINKDY